MRFIPLFIAAALLASACGSGEPTGASACPPAGSTADDGKPSIEVPDADPPDQLTVTDISDGTGDVAEAGGQIEAHYVGVAWSTGEEFDASWDRGQPIPFTLGVGQVIPGWDEGIEGMKVGGRRCLEIPPDMAYGASGSPPVIGPDETLVFVVDLVSAQAAPDAS